MKTRAKTRPAKKKPSRPRPPVTADVDIRTSLTPDAIGKALLDNLYYVQGRVTATATRNDWYMALAYTIRDRVLQRWMATIETYISRGMKSVSYLSAEFLMGPHLGSTLVNLGILDETRKAMSDAGLDLDGLLDQEEEPGLGNGGLGRLAACYLESLASVEALGVGYGIRYEFGIFDQLIRDGWQVEITDKWLHYGNPWELPRPEIAFTVKFGGHTEHGTDNHGKHIVKWVPHREVLGIAYDTPVLGYKVNTVNLLRLWKSEAVESFDVQAFNVGDYYGAVEDKVSTENISKILYPNDEPLQGKQLRLEQQYFFVSCSLQDLIRVHLRKKLRLHEFHKHNAVQLNDTHPSIAVAELMRLLVDENSMDWDTAWDVTQNTLAFTNHTLLPEALEKWPLPLFGRLLPRHLEIIFEINQRFLDDVRAKYPGDDARVQRMSLIDETGERYVRMANLATVGCHAINGVAALHTELLKRDVLHDFHDFFPERFLNVTNGVTPRRWIGLANPGLAKLITSKIGDKWMHDMEHQMRLLERHAEDAEFQKKWREVKLANKKALADMVLRKAGVTVDPNSMFDIQVKRIHEYKRQHLNVLHVITLYNRLKRNHSAKIPPRTVIFGGKAAPGYFMAKLIIKLINSVADVVNNDPDIGNRLKIAFIPDFNVKTAQPIYPAADLSEQISTAGKEASGTGNMKFAMNGALTIGTLDGANIEIREEVGEENFFLFGLTAEQVRDVRLSEYRPMDYVESHEELREVIDQLSSGFFSNGEKDLFKPLVDSLLSQDDFMVLADYRSYIEAQERVNAAFLNPKEWTRMSILNSARSGKFSSDRAVREYCEKIWGVKPIRITTL